MVELAPTGVGQTWHSQAASQCIRQRKDPCLTAGDSSSSTGKHLPSLSARRPPRMLGMRSGQRSMHSMTLGGALRLVRQCSCSLRHPFRPCLKKVSSTFQDATPLRCSVSTPLPSRNADAAAPHLFLAIHRMQSCCCSSCLFFLACTEEVSHCPSHFVSA